MDVMEQHL
jgi:hypothetical protein